MGPTASGKTGFAEQLAEQINAQLINADAFQAYRGMDIGTAKPDRKDLYRLLDIKNPDEDYGVGEFCARAQEELETLFEQGKNAVVVGGTGLYIRALFQEYDDLKPAPDQVLRAQIQERLATEGLEEILNDLGRQDPLARLKVDPKNPVRVTRALERALDTRPPIRVSLPAFRKMKVGLLANSLLVTTRIEERTRLMVQNGWVQEVMALLAAGYSSSDPGFRAIGYTEIADYLLGKTDLEEAIATTIAQTRRYAKRQRTWLRSEPELVKHDPTAPDVLQETIRSIRSVS
jgi:tRNA dimethylallyltransferase